MAEAAVGEDGGEEAAWEVSCVHEDEEGDGCVVVEVEVGLRVGYYVVEAEVDAPEGEEESWMLGLVWDLGLGNGICETIVLGNDRDLT